VQVDTTNILFICGGAFDGLEKSSAAAPKRAASLRRGRKEPEERQGHQRDPETVEPEDLIKYGLIPEFVGRLPVVATLVELDEQALIKY